ncbi:MAG: hypothetical protein HOA14_14575 [Planctomycetaceae bacterium]|nr:hypothetical protein [Planctomycetaceae bacterium]
MITKLSLLIASLTIVALTALLAHPIIAAERPAPSTPTAWSWISATTGDSVKKTGSWQHDQFRNARAAHLKSYHDGDELTIPFSGTAIGIRLAGQNTPEYLGQGDASQGQLVCSIDDTVAKTIACTHAGREHILAHGLKPGDHILRIRHAAVNNQTGCRIDGFWALPAATGSVTFQLTGERSQFLTDCRLIIVQGDKIIRSTISRNWISGTCSVLLPAGTNYRITIQASGWQTVSTSAFDITANTQTTLAIPFLNRAVSTIPYHFRYPSINNQAIRTRGSSFRARFLGFTATIKTVRIKREIGNKTISRLLAFRELSDRADYYDRELEVMIPADTPGGIYDLEIAIEGSGRTSVAKSPRSVAIIANYTQNPRFVSWGHLDTSGQYQAEYLQRLCTMVNIIAPDMVLASNCVNPAYISGTMASLRSPYMVNFGNHQMPGHKHWYGADIQIVPLTPKINVLNYALPWFHGTEAASGLFNRYPDSTYNIINGFESNAPIEFLNQHTVRLIHDAHGLGSKAMIIDGTQTQRVGKTNSNSFRVIQFKHGKVESCTYNDHPTAAIPFTRTQVMPLRVKQTVADDTYTATVTNELKMDFKDATIRFLVPADQTYQPSAGKIKSTTLSDDKSLKEIVVSINIPRETTFPLNLSPN